MQYQLSAACLCNIGRVRGNNEDNFYFDGRTLPLNHTSLEKTLLQTMPTDPFSAFGVFDGMGGEQNGEAASFAAAEMFKEKCRWLREYVAAPQEFLASAFTAMNDAVAAERGRCLAGSVLRAWHCALAIMRCTAAMWVTAGRTGSIKVHCSNFLQTTTMQSSCGNMVLWGANPG